MNKIQMSDLNLSVKESVRKTPDKDWVNEIIYALIWQRINYYRNELEKAMAKGHAYQMNTVNSEIVIYNNGSEEYGHFSIPIYNTLVDWYEKFFELNRFVVQQALRQHLINLNDISSLNTKRIISINRKYDQTLDDVGLMLTELMMIP